jgi:predicted esterase
MLSIGRTFLIAVILLLFVTSGTQAQKLNSGPQVLTFFSDVDDTDQPYGLYLPKNFNPKKKYPLVISLHGANSNHRLNLRRVFGKSNLPGETDVEATRYFPEWKDVDYIVASPLARGTMGYQGIAEKDVYDVLADVKKRFPIDEDRIYLTGLSMGGGGTLWLGLTRPDIWAAIAPVCPASPRGTAELMPNALNYPVHFFQGGADPVVNPEGTRQWTKRLDSLSTKTEYTEYPGVGHNSWENAYKDGYIFEWFSKFYRNRFPDRVRFSTSWYKYNNAYWVHIDELTPGTLANIDSKFTAPNRIEITTSELGAFTLNLAGHPKFKSNRPVEVTIDGKVINAQVKDSLSLKKRDGAWTAAQYRAPENSKCPGAEGPISEAIASRHIYIYGTGGNPSREELQSRRDQATLAATWSSQRNRLMAFPRTLSDREVRPSDLESSNLVLFGTKETNSLIEKFSDRLPIQLDSSAVNTYGLLYVFPIDGHYAIVNSGLLWWTSPPPVSGAPPTALATRPSSRPRSQIPGPAGALVGFKDYILFKESLDNVIAEGYFDNNWRMPEPDAEKMKSTGVIIVKGTQSPK